MYKDIAIIGISMKLPGADNIKEFHRNLKEKKDCIRSVSKERRELLRLNPEKDYLQVGYIEGIENFDNKFFNISPKECEYMAPEQRLSLEMAADAILDAGYSLEKFRGTNCSVFVSEGENEYKLLVGQGNGTAYTGNLKALTAGKISYYLDLRGPNSTIDATCSSALLGVHEGCMKLVSEETDYSLVGGIVVNIHIPEFEDDDYNNLGVVSKEGRSKSFDASASGTGIGEGGGFILLKRLEDAILDNDHIYGVIKGSAVNCDGGRGSSLTAPSVEGQRDVILKAWERGNIDPEEITDIESHGTGTLIGDPIEVQALQEGFSKYTDKKSYVYLGAVKSSIGHLAEASGISSVLKCISEIENDVSYPIVHYKEANPYIDFKNTSLIPTDKVVKWDKSKKRIMGINSFGFSGTNVHIVLENYLEHKSKEDIQKKHILKVSAKTKSAFNNNVINIVDFLKGYDGSFESLCYTLNCGRDDYEYRQGFVFKDKDELIRKLETCKYEKIQKDDKKVVLVLRNETEDIEAEFVEKEAIYKKIKDLNIKFDYILADEFGKIIISYCNGDIDEIKAEKDIRALKFNQNNEGYLNAVNKLSKDNKLVIIHIGSYSHYEKSGIITICIENDYYLHHICDLYENDIQFNWRGLYEECEIRKISAPTYAFDKNKFWIYPKEVEVNKRETEDEKKDYVKVMSDEKIEQDLNDLWCEVLDVDEIEKDNDFFELGGNSLIGMMIIEEIESNFNVKIKFDEFYDNETFEKFMSLIKQKISKNSKESLNSEDDVIEHKNIVKHEINSLQKITYYSTILNEKNSAWNLCMAAGIKGHLDMNRLNESLKKIIEKHDSFRSVFYEENNVLIQKILDKYNYKIKEYSLGGETEKERYEASMKMLNNHANTTLTVDKPPFEVEVYHVTEENCILFMSISHIISDGSSLVLFVKELVNNYNGEEDKNEVLQQIDHNLWKEKLAKSEEGKKQNEHWKNQLEDIQLEIDFPGDRKIREEDYVGEQTRFTIEEDFYKKLCKFIRKEKVSMCALSLYAFNLLIAKRTLKSDVYSTLAVANRRNKQFSNVCGCLADLVIIRSIFDKSRTVEDELVKTRDTLNSALDNQECSYYDLLIESTDDKNLKKTEISDFLLTFQNYKSTNLTLNGVDLYEVNMQRKGYMANIVLCMYESDDNMFGMLEYNNNKYSKKFMDEFGEEYMQILKYIVDNPNQILKEYI